LCSIGDVTAVAPVLETEPVGMEPNSGLFLNTAAQVIAQLQPHELLKQIKAYEQRMGRDISHSHYQPRVIDVDILAAETKAGPMIIQSDSLVVPHPRMAQRRFVLEPLARIAPDWLHPVLQKTVRRLLEEC